MARALIHMPATAQRGDIIEIRALIGHPMETGYRVGADGKLLARDIIRSFVCRYNGEQVFGAELHQAISANPYIAFFTTATESGTLECIWQGDNGFAHTEKATITVSAA
ncbi:thiosulfate oxidation carrier complex protein SoxZ [Duganella sp. FT50W]|uniref:Thiosulfate oxidation carrier complex protein SoxZ n=1 Tax=Duganella lactea TaxID=2692173 RepID=A0A6L8MT05_9BURK|nr:thiosulfate oxidation carrier complex protein SoxZ [Duganella lactea]MYM36609.1 thiosulfate oxidation carrier complex protein SoxZ [Duganella lactea]MYM85188.1 thiosulfate oxidation carrier complex protein SoxZ [Duganella lactea]